MQGILGTVLNWLGNHFPVQLHTLKGSSFYCTLCLERWRFSIPPVTPCRAFALAVASAGGVETQMSIHLTSPFLRAFAQMSPLSYPIETSFPQPWYFLSSFCIFSLYSTYHNSAYHVFALFYWFTVWILPWRRAISILFWICSLCLACHKCSGVK